MPPEVCPWDVVKGTPLQFYHDLANCNLELNENFITGLNIFYIYIYIYVLQSGFEWRLRSNISPITLTSHWNAWLQKEIYPTNKELGNWGVYVENCIKSTKVENWLKFVNSLNVLCICSSHLSHSMTGSRVSNSILQNSNPSKLAWYIFSRFVFTLWTIFARIL